MGKTFEVRALPAFNRKLRKSGDDMKDLVVKFQRVLTLELLRRVVLRTPVDTGRARGGWQVSVTNPPDGQGAADRGGSQTIAKGLPATRGLRLGETSWVANNVVYILQLEGVGTAPSSKQAPNGMMAVSLAEIGSVL